MTACSSDVIRKSDKLCSALRMYLRATLRETATHRSIISGQETLGIRATEMTIELRRQGVLPDDKGAS